MASAEGAPLRALFDLVWFWPHVGGGDQHAIISKDLLAIYRRALEESN